jgi:hypothetical protein
LVAEPGDTFIVFVPLVPLLHEYEVVVAAPLAVRVAVCPTQMLVEFTVIVGCGKKVTVAVPVATHPAELVPVTVYVVVEVGLTLILEVVCPVFQEYVEPPEAESVTLEFSQTLTGFPELIETVGSGFTVTVFVSVCLYPQTPSAIQVYVVVVLGESVID